ncbi:MAG: hypothetical protein E7449_01050 [Ruminococcaceae bacterium]|nr:hypothetical protein [Oscillospiraceae bacterium]
MARGRQQKWICKECRSEFSVQGKAPRFCCICGSEDIGRAPSYELVRNFEEKRNELHQVCSELNPVYERFKSLKAKYNEVMAYWKQQRRRGYISSEEYNELASMYDGAKQNDDEQPEGSDSCGS